MINREKSKKNCENSGKTLQRIYKKDNKNPSLTVPEYSERWLENFVKTRKKDYDGF